MDREAWWATVHGVARSWAHLSDLAHISGRGRAVGSGGSGHLGGAVDSPGRGDGSLGRVPGGPFPRMNPV